MAGQLQDRVPVDGGLIAAPGVDPKPSTATSKDTSRLDVKKRQRPPDCRTRGHCVSVLLCFGITVFWYYWRASTLRM